MKVEHFVIHHIQKDKHRPTALQLREEESSLDDGAKGADSTSGLIPDFVENASKMFQRQRSGRVFADIGKDGNTFADVLDSYLSSSTPFIDFSKRLARELAKTMGAESLATGGYMAVADFTRDTRQLLVLMIRQEVGYAVDPDSLELRESVHLDLSTINVGASIDVDGYQANETHHLSLVRGLKDLSRYFRAFLGVENYKTAQEETIDLANALDDYFATDPERFDSSTQDAIRQGVASLIRDQKGQQIPLLTIAAAVDPEDPEAFRDYANDAGVSAEVTGDVSALKSWLRVNYKNPRMRLDFDKNLLHDSIERSPNAGELTITVSAFPKLADKLNEANR